MVFSSLFFIGVFLPVFLFIYHLCKTITAKNRVLLAFSLVFYAYGGIRYLILLICMSFIGYFFALAIARGKSKQVRRFWFIFGVSIVLLNLVLFKYANLLVPFMEALTKKGLPIFDVALPIGISFYTFKLISYMADVYMGKTAAFHKFFPVLLYTSLFHHALQGPIVRINDMREDIYIRRTDGDDVSYGVWRFVLGLSKKLLLADPIGTVADTLIPMQTDKLSVLQSVPVTGIWLGILAFGLQLYLDFSAYSDMAIGLGKMIGFSYPENFRYPYVASSIKDFWRRWHISLSTFFKDYVYIPMGGSRVSRVHIFFNLLVVWSLTGLWHGAGWNFILWGLYYFVLLQIEKGLHVPQWKMGRFLWYPVTFVAVFFGWLLFRFTDAQALDTMVKGFFGLGGRIFYAKQVGLVLKNHFFLLALGLLASSPLFLFLGRRIQERFEETHTYRSLLSILKVGLIIVLLLLSFLSMIGSSFTPFLYEQF